MESLLEKLCTYSQSGAYPFHMPGHKRNIHAMDKAFPNPYLIDITEIEGFDNLHHAEGILKESMERAAKIYGADETFYLVNGSTCGILSAVSACVSRRGKLLISRNCHKSVYHSIFLNELEAEYLYPQEIESLGILGGILPEDVEKKLEEYPEIQAVLVVSPTYDGIVSDIQGIAKIVHQHGKILIVDEAHGAHFPFGKKGEFPLSALENGGDVVIQSLHKTLPSLTQTAVLHLKKGYLTEKQIVQIKTYLSIYQSSSPSYVLMAGIEYGISFMEKFGQEYLTKLKKMLTDFREQCREFSALQIPGKELMGKNGVFDVDESKILIGINREPFHGKWLRDFLWEEFSLEMELYAPQYVLALTSVFDQKEGFERLFTALRSADRKVLENKQKSTLQKEKSSRYNKEKGEPEKVCTVFCAVEHKKNFCHISQCEGKISGDFIYLYPPGIPCLVPGERITKDRILQIEDYFRMGLAVQGMADTEGKRIQVLT